MSFEEIINWISQNPEYGSLSIGLVGFFESFILVGTFWPSIILLLVAMALNEAGLNIVILSIYAGLGSLIGDVLSYYLGLSLGPQIKKTNFLKKRETQINKTEAFITKYGWGAVFLGRFIPAIRPFIPFFTGLSSMPWRIFILSDFFACFLWAISLALILLGIDNIVLFFS